MKNREIDEICQLINNYNDEKKLNLNNYNKLLNVKLCVIKMIINIKQISNTALIMDY